MPTPVASDGPIQNRYRRYSWELWEASTAELSEDELQRMALVHAHEELFYCKGVLDRRPQWEFVCGRDAAPHRQEEGSCILRRRDGAG